MTVRFLPGMFAPKIHEYAFGKSVWCAMSEQTSVQSVCVGLDVDPASVGRRHVADRRSTPQALGAAEGNKSAAADLLGIGRTTLYRRIRQLGLDGYEGSL